MLNYFLSEIWMDFGFLIFISDPDRWSKFYRFILKLLTYEIWPKFCDSVISSWSVFPNGKLIHLVIMIYS